MISAIKLKKYMAGVNILGVIINKFRYDKKLCPIILLKVDKSLEIGFYCTILPFHLAVYLQIEDNKKFPLNAIEIT